MVPVPDTTELAKEVEGLVELAKGFTVDSDVTRGTAANALGIIRGKRERVKEHFAKPIEDARATKLAAERSRKSIEEAWLTLDRPAEQAEGIIKRKIGDYDDQVYVLKVEAERKAKLAAAEKQRAEAEAARLQAESELKARHAEMAEAEAARARALGDTQGEEQARAQAVAAKAAAAVDMEAAKEAQAEAASVPIPFPAPALPTKATGAQSRRVWKWKLVDFAAVPDKWKMLDSRLIAHHVRASGESAVGTIPGIAVYSEANIAAERI
ncbi:MAG: hypothetical protein ABII82_06765 [Verrucomicrobiota bacterium]